MIMLRNKKRIAVITLITLLAGSAIFYAATASRKETVYGTPAEVAVGKAVAALNKDSDTDDLKDWEEELWNTAITNPDTDHDGTKDGEEIRQGRNPLVAGPNDALDPETLHAKVNEARPEDETRTAAFSRAFFIRYLDLRRQSGGALPEDALETLISGAVAEAAKTAPAKTYGRDEIKEEGAGPEALRAYGNRLGELLSTHSPQDLEEPAAIVTRSLEEGAEGELEKLSPHIELYRGFISALFALAAPAEAAASHLAILNAMEGTRAGLSGIQALFTDPLNALPSFAMYQESAVKLSDAFRLLQAEFIRSRMRFSPEESGYLIQELGV